MPRDRVSALDDDNKSGQPLAMRTVMFLVLLAAASCGEAADPEAPAKCRQFSKSYCDQRAKCGEVKDHQSCIADIERSLPGGCDAVTRIRDVGSYQSCLDAVAALDCQQVGSGEQPESCKNRIIID
jgi:hypothetical protein